MMAWMIFFNFADENFVVCFLIYAKFRKQASDNNDLKTGVKRRA